MIKQKSEKKNDQKAAKILSAILAAFIITWTPYNINVVINAFWDNFFDKFQDWHSFGIIMLYFQTKFHLCYKEVLFIFLSVLALLHE